MPGMEPGTFLRPHLEATSVQSIDFRALKRPYIILDVDNTLVPTRSQILSPEVITFFKALRKEGVIKGICLLSNGGIRKRKQRARLSYLADLLDAESVSVFGFAMKPHRKGFLQAMTALHSTPETTVMIGDQLYTDVLGANRLGIYTILVRPLSKDHFLTIPKRIFEHRARKRWE